MTIARSHRRSTWRVELFMAWSSHSKASSTPCPVSATTGCEWMVLVSENRSRRKYERRISSDVAPSQSTLLKRTRNGAPTSRGSSCNDSRTARASSIRVTSEASTTRTMAWASR
eukprot:Amastigsp_a676470_296.p3 type:complete len:114 gc:universal Amastigsp_a676470_296:41-382(+)